MYININPEDAEEMQRNGTLEYNHPSLAIGYVVLSVGVFLIALSRLYLGMHSIDQVTAGLLFGFYFHFLYNVIFKD